MNEFQRTQQLLRRKMLLCKTGRKALPVDPASLLDLLKNMKGDKPYKCEGLPPDATLERVDFDTNSGQMILIIKSKDFPATVLENTMRWLELRITH